MFGMKSLHTYVMYVCIIVDDHPQVPFTFLHSLSLSNSDNSVDNIIIQIYIMTLQTSVIRKRISMHWAEIKFHSNSPPHAPIVSTHPSYVDINHKIIKYLPRPIHKAYILSSIWLKISLKWPISFIFGSILATNVETNKRSPKIIYLSTMGAYWNEYSTFSEGPEGDLHALRSIMGGETTFSRSYVLWFWQAWAVLPIP